MALLTTTNLVIGAVPVVLDTDTDESDADTELTLTPATGHLRRILSVEVVYSAAVTKTVTITRNSGAGPTFDIVLKNLVLSNETSGIWTPNNKKMLSSLDALDVVAPAGGSGVTATLTINTERF